jgi:hypothetical protein
MGRPFSVWRGQGEGLGAFTQLICVNFFRRDSPRRSKLPASHQLRAVGTPFFTSACHVLPIFPLYRMEWLAISTLVAGPSPSKSGDGQGLRIAPPQCGSQPGYKSAALQTAAIKTKAA